MSMDIKVLGIEGSENFGATLAIQKSLKMKLAILHLENKDIA